MKNTNRDNRSSGAGGGRKFRGADSGNEASVVGVTIENSVIEIQEDL